MAKLQVPRTPKDAAAGAMISWLDWISSKKTKHALVGSAVVLGCHYAELPVPIQLALGALWGVVTVAQGVADLRGKG